MLRNYNEITTRNGEESDGQSSGSVKETPLYRSMNPADRLGLVVTRSAGGAGKWPSEVVTLFEPTPKFISLGLFFRFASGI